MLHTDQTRPGNAEYERARRWMTLEANAAIAGAFAGGASEVTVADAHGSYRNLLADELDPRARLAAGKPRVMGMLGGLEAGFDAVLLVGFHSRSQAPGVLAHTINSSAFARIWLNDQELGEAGIYGALAGEMGIPVVYASGDDAFAAETQPLFPHAIFTITKQTLGRFSAVSLSPQAACDAIRADVQHAMAGIPKAIPLRLDTPLHTRLQTLTPAHADLFCQWPQLEREDAVTLHFTTPSVSHAVRMLNCLSAMATALR